MFQPKIFGRLVIDIEAKLCYLPLQYEGTIYVCVDEVAEDSLTEIEKSILKMHFNFRNSTLTPTAQNAERNFNINYIEKNRYKKMVYYGYNRFRCWLKNYESVFCGSMAHVTVFDKEICLNLETYSSVCDQYTRSISNEMPSRHAPDTPIASSAILTASPASLATFPRSSFRHASIPSTAVTLTPCIKVIEISIIFLILFLE